MPRDALCLTCPVPPAMPPMPPELLSNPACENFLYGFKGAPPARHRRAGGPGRMQGREVIERGCVIERGTTTRTMAGRRWASWPTPGRRPCRALSGGSPDRRVAAARSAGPHPQVGGTRRHAAPMAVPARTGPGPSSVRASSRRARSQSRALPAVASPRRWAQAPTLEQ